MTAAEIIRNLDLHPHPEGGWFGETYRSDEKILAAGLPSRYGEPRAFSTAIYFLLEAGQFSAFHRLRSDEIWFHHAGGALDVWRIDEQGMLHTDQISPDDSRWQVVFPRGHWFAARPAEGEEFALVGCVVSPGFDFADFELASRRSLSEQYPAHRDLIRELTHS